MIFVGSFFNVYRDWVFFVLLLDIKAKLDSWKMSEKALFLSKKMARKQKFVYVFLSLVWDFGVSSNYFLTQLSSF